MKHRKIFVILLIASLVMCAVPSFAQNTQGEQMVVNTNDLPRELVAQLKARQQMQKVSQYVTWADEVADATDKILGSVSNHAAEFSETDLGRFAMMLIAWKVAGSDILAMGNDLIGYLVGIPFFFIGGLTILWSYRKTTVKRMVCTKKERSGFFKVVREYAPSSPSLEADEGMLYHGIAVAILFLISSAIMFT